MLERFLKTKDEDRKIEDISAVELNEYISQFIISVGTEYEPASLRILIAKLRTTLEEKELFCQHNDLVFEKTRKVLQFKQKQRKKQGKENKPNVFGSFDKRRDKSIVRQGFARYV